jgi:hypothetical protein
MEDTDALGAPLTVALEITLPPVPPVPGAGLKTVVA